MHPILLDITDALRDLSDKVLGATEENRPLIEVYGWQSPAVTRRELSWFPLALSNKIVAADVSNLPKPLEENLKLVPAQLSLLHATTIAQMFTSNSATAISSYLLTLEVLERTLDPILGWEQISDSKAIPSKLASRLRSMQSAIDDLQPDKEKLERQIKLIEEATEAAESLPTDLQALKAARSQVADVSTDAAENIGKIQIHEADAGRIALSLKDLEAEAEKIVAQSQEVLRIATSTGLAAAFDERAERLDTSMWWWLVGLILALSGGVTIGVLRYQSLEASLAAPQLNWSIIWLQLLLSLFSVAAPVWLAWLATKQISQRFRLSEDYAFKSSVAKAYEGYRREAARIDTELEEKLFASALSRFDEAPLRLVETETHGSPLHELVASDAFLAALKAVPSLAKELARVYGPSKRPALLKKRKESKDVNIGEEPATE
ncbi:hypothetical protein [Mucilaginibacter sp. BT774]|uniref:hypothetical protein n=1 Tax=Mucilaginibacter sp. BT774 TaxID=3062276 RepID=UPI002676B576|nr:hypothetical protein [Mucilaginibacter sp. BT774]MDO3627654.1 hypothetical protein [Mucilaginibacter sp. BT774]